MTLLGQDHERIALLFGNLELATSAAEKERVLAAILSEWRVLSRLELETFYPAMALALPLRRAALELAAEHVAIDGLIARLGQLEPGHETHAACIRVLDRVIRAHAEEQQSRLLDPAIALEIDLVSLGQRLTSRKRAMLTCLPFGPPSPGAAERP